MKYILPGFSIVCLAAGAVVWYQRAPAARPPAPTAAASTAVSTQHPDGQMLLANAQRVLGQHASIEASLRHDVDLFGHQLLGKGTLKQLNSTGQALIRLELRIQLQGQTSSLLQISD